jgi:toxin FitB
MAYLIDTNVLSEIRKRARADPSVLKWWATVSPADLYVSVLTLGEIRYGVESKRARDPAQGRVLEKWLEVTRKRFSDRLLPVTEGIADRWGNLGIGDPIPDVDGLLAATALEHGLTVVTRNTKDFIRAGTPVLNPWNWSE